MVRDFFVPALENSTRYDRGVGYFSSGWIKVAALGMLSFASRGGKARWVTSPILNQEDWDALKAGDDARNDPILRDALLRNIASLAEALEKDTLAAISWMIADGIVDFRLALPRERLSGGDFHDKFGIFYDSINDALSFNGSYNDSIQGLRNYESLKVFPSWTDAFRPLVNSDIDRFEKLWNNADPNVRVFELPEAARSSILQLRSSERPYPKPSWIAGNAAGEAPGRRYFPPADFTPREYQKEAMRAWLAANGRGIFAMATGAGKTMTALYLAHRLREQASRLVIVVVCPYINLAKQWIREIQRFGFDPVGCFEGRSNWAEELTHEITSVVSGSSSLSVAVVTNRTFISQGFQSIFRPGVVSQLVIADEAHNLGARAISKQLDTRVRYRLGLSATPKRHFDDEGSESILRYFGPIVYDFSLDRAIDEGYLCRYRYFPILVDLTSDEGTTYWELSRQIGKYLGGDSEELSAHLKMLLIKRSRLLASAKNKQPALSSVLNSLEEPIERAIVYCGDGRVEVDAASDQESIRQIESVVSQLGHDHCLKVRKFTCDEPPEEREEILVQLRDKKLDAVVAIRCLDEGIDVPDIRMAFIMASSTNPRQFIQRRGRLLRKAPGKSRALIWDFIVAPPDMGGEFDDKTFSTERRLLKRELERVVDFCRTAENGDWALSQLLPLRRKYNLLSY